MSKIRVGILMGGPSAEREISLITGKAICENLNKEKYDILSIEYGKDFKFYIKNKKKKTLIDLYKIKKKIDIMFIALHGTYGEDGGVQGLCKSLGIKYTGSNVLSSSVAMNKALAGRIYEKIGLQHPNFLDFNRIGWKQSREILVKNIIKKIKFPLIIKPVEQGSAIGVHLIKNKEELVSKLNTSFKQFNWMMAQQYIDGDEGTCGVLDVKGEPVALPPTHIVPNAGEFYDYKSKYAKGGSTHVCPADFNKTINKKLQKYAIEAHQALACRAMSRTDFFITKTKKIYIIETNTIPGMTPTSLLPEAASAMGIDFEKMLDLIIKASI